jgi:hypothetical protein
MRTIHTTSNPTCHALFLSVADVKTVRPDPGRRLAWRASGVNSRLRRMRRGHFETRLHLVEKHMASINLRTAATAQSMPSIEDRFRQQRVDLTRSPSHRRMNAVCAKRSSPGWLPSTQEEVIQPLGAADSPPDIETSRCPTFPMQLATKRRAMSAVWSAARSVGEWAAR